MLTVIGVGGWVSPDNVERPKARVSHRLRGVPQSLLLTEGESLAI